MTLRITAMPRPTRAPQVCSEPAEAAARVVVMAALVFGGFHFVTELLWYEVGWIGPVGLRSFWLLVPFDAVPCALLLWFTSLPRLKLAAANGLIVAGLFVLWKGLLPLVGVGKFPNPDYPTHILGPPVYCLVAFAGAWLTAWLAHLARADLKRP